MGAISNLERILTRLRSSSPCIHRTLCRIADVCMQLFGEAGTDLPTLQERIASRAEHLRIREELLAKTPKDLGRSAFTDKGPTLESPRLLNWEEMKSEPMRQAAREQALDPDDADRKVWEKSAVLHMVRSYGFLDSKKTGLGIGVGTESLPFYLSRFCERIVGIDKYRSKQWQNASMSAEDVYETATVPFNRDALVFMDCDMRSLAFPDEEFDFVWSVSAVEHVSSVDEYVNTFMEVSRVLKPEGMAFITAEWNLVQENPVYKPGLIVLDRVLYPWLVANLEDMHPTEKLRPSQPHSVKHVMATRFRDPLGRTIRPCINILSGGSFITPVVLVFRKK